VIHCGGVVVERDATARSVTSYRAPAGPLQFELNRGIKYYYTTGTYLFDERQQRVFDALERDLCAAIVVVARLFSSATDAAAGRRRRRGRTGRRSGRPLGLAVARGGGVVDGDDRR